MRSVRFFPVLLLAVALPSVAVEPKPQQCEWLRSRYSALFAQQQAGDKSPQIKREMSRFLYDYGNNGCKGPILRR